MKLTKNKNYFLFILQKPTAYLQSWYQQWAKDEIERQNTKKKTPKKSANAEPAKVSSHVVNHLQQLYGGSGGRNSNTIPLEPGTQPAENQLKYLEIEAEKERKREKEKLTADLANVEFDY